jgi:hypothetical protein
MDQMAGVDLRILSGCCLETAGLTYVCQLCMKYTHSSMKPLYSAVSICSSRLEHTLRQPSDNHHWIVTLRLGQRNSLNPQTSWVTTT